MIDSTDSYMNDINEKEMKSDLNESKDFLINENEKELDITNLLESTSLNNVEVNSINDEFGLKEKLSNRLLYYEGDTKEQLEALLQNDDIINLFINLVKEYDSSDNHDNHFESQDTEQLIKEGFDENDIPESWDEYLSIESSTDNFIKFLTDGNGLDIVKKEIIHHIDAETGKIREDYPISNKALMRKIKRSFKNDILNKYNTDYNIQETPQDKLNNLGSKIMSGIDDIVGLHLQSGGDSNGKGLLSAMKGLLDEMDLAGLVQNQEIRSGLDTFFTLNIKELSDNVIKNANKNDNLETEDNQLNLQLQAYLLIYDQYILSDQHLANYSGKELTNCHSDLSVFLDEIISCESSVGITRETERMKKIKEMKERKRHEEMERRKKKAEMNRQINSRNALLHKNEKSFQIEEEIKSNVNVQEASGIELIKNNNLSDKIPNSEENEQSKLSDEELNHLKGPAFDDSRNEFLNQNEFMKSIITKDKMKRLFNLNTCTLDEKAREEFKRHEFLGPNQKEEQIPEHIQTKIDKIHSTLLSFSSIMDNKLSNLTENVSDNKKQIDNTVKNYALGAVIDNMKGIFNNTKEQEKSGFKSESGFKLDEKMPIQISNNDMLMYGNFNGTKINLRYDMQSGKLYINSYITEKRNPDRIVIGNDYPDKEIGDLMGFNNVLNEYYNKPPFTLNEKLNEQRIFHDRMEHKRDKVRISKSNPTKYENLKIREHQKMNERKDIIRDNENKFNSLLHGDLNLIGEQINEYTNTEKNRNALINNFAKTFNLKNDYTDNKIEFKKGNENSNNAYDIFQILSHSSENELKEFQKMLGEICNWSGITRGQNNSFQNKSSEIPKLIFESKIPDNDEELNAINSFKKHMCSITSENLRLSYDIDSDLGIVALVKENCITTKDRLPKLDIVKMNQFIDDMEDGIADIELQNALKS